MAEKTKLLHIALQYSDREKANIFFTDILNISKIKSFNLSEKLSKEIFNINNFVEVDVFANDQAYFEIFYTQLDTNKSYAHVCIEIENKEKFINQCKKYNLSPYFVKKDDKELLFVKDFSGNIFEVKERIS